MRLFQKILLILVFFNFGSYSNVGAVPESFADLAEKLMPSVVNISTTQTDKRTDYPGKKIARIVQNKWKNNFTEKIGLVGGNEWQGGNLSYHLKSRPKWDNLLESKKTISLKNIEGGFVIIGDKETLSQICGGIFFEVEAQGICMIGKKK